MKRFTKATGGLSRRGLALLLALAVLMSVCAVGIVAVAAATIGSTVYVDISQNSNWKNKTIVATFDNSTAKVTLTGSGNMLSGTAPSGAKKMTLTAYPAGYPTELANAAPSGKYRVIWKKDSNNRSYIYAWNASSDYNHAWTGEQGTLSGNFYYKDLNKKYNNVIFNANSDKNKTADLTAKWIGNVAYYDGSGFASSLTSAIDVSSLSGERNLFIMNSNGTLNASKYQYNGSGINTTWKTVYLYNADWNAAYVTYDLNDAYQTTVEMEAQTQSGVDYFKAQIPAGATFKFSPSATSLSNGTVNLTAPNTDDPLYVMEASKYWTTLDKLPQDSTRIPNTFGEGIHAVTATYFDYLTDNEVNYGYLNRADGKQNLPFDGYLNPAISAYSQANKIKNPLYFGNLYGKGDGYNGWYNYKNNVNNSAGLTNYWYAVQGLASPTLSGNHIAAPSTNTAGAADMPIFDAAWLKGDNSKSKELGKVFKSYFPFVETTDSSTGITTYSFDSSGGSVRDAGGNVSGQSKANSDNVFFTWNGKEPVAVNYGKGEAYARADGSKQGNDEFQVDGTGFGIFPFDNTPATMTAPAGDKLEIRSDQIWISSDHGTVALYAWTDGAGNNGGPKALNKNGYGYFVINSGDLGSYQKFILTSKANGWDNQTANLNVSDYPKGKAYTYSGSTLSTAGTDAYSQTYTKTGQHGYNDYGFGVRMDMDFRVPENGTLPGGVDVPADQIWIQTGNSSVFVHAWDDGDTNQIDVTYSKSSDGYIKLDSRVTSRAFFLVANNNSYNGKTADQKVTGKKGTVYSYNNGSFDLVSNNAVTFDYSGDDDLWVYISDDSGNSELVLDLGGDHKFSSGHINFKTMTATADFVFMDYNQSFSEKPKVPSDEFWVAKKHTTKGGSDASFTSLYVKTWDKTDKDGNHIDQYFAPFETSDYTFTDGTTETFFKFKTSILGSSDQFILSTSQSEAGEVCTLGLSSHTVNGNAFKVRLRNEGNLAEDYNHANSSLPDNAFPAKSVETPFFGGQHLDPNKTYHMTVFYLERGEIESNLQVSFTMTPVKNNVLVDKVVDGYDNINNSDIANDVMLNDTFTYVSSNSAGDASGKDYTHNSQLGENSAKVTGADGSFSLMDDESAYFVSQFETGSYLTVGESGIENLANGRGQTLSDRYDTRWELFDSGNMIDSGTGTEDSFKLIGHTSDGTEDPERKAELQLTFHNALKTDHLIVTKKVLNKQSEDITSTVTEDFFYAVTLDVNGGTDYKAYPLYYYVGTYSGSMFVPDSYHYTDDGTFSFAPQKAVMIGRLPRGASYRVTETVPAGYRVHNGASKSGVIGQFDGRVAPFVNQQSSGETTLEFTKTIDGHDYTGSQFGFEMEWLGTGSSTATKSYVEESNVATLTAETNEVSGGKLTFTLAFNHVGWYRYSIAEKDLATDLAETGYVKDYQTKYTEFEIFDNSGTLEMRNKKYYSDAGFTQEISEVTFSNTVAPGQIVIHKDDQTGDAVSDTVFAVVKVKNGVDGGTYTDIINSMLEAEKAETDPAKKRLNTGVTIGQDDDQTATDHMNPGDPNLHDEKVPARVVFEDLPIYQNGDKVFDLSTGEWTDADCYYDGIKTAQQYMVVEYSPTDGYNTNKTLKFVTFPYEGQFAVTFDYTNVAVVMPQSSGDGMSIFFVVGIGILGTSALLVAAYVLYDRRVSASRRYRHGKK